MYLNIRVVRLAADLTQTKLARLVGVTVACINKIEFGKRNPSIQLALRLQEVLKQPIAHLLEREVTNKSA